MRKFVGTISKVHFNHFVNFVNFVALWLCGVKSELLACLIESIRSQNGLRDRKVYKLIYIYIYVQLDIKNQVLPFHYSPRTFVQFRAVIVYNFSGLVSS